MKKVLKVTLTIKLALLSGFMGYLVGQYQAENKLEEQLLSRKPSLELSIGFSDLYNSMNNSYINLDTTIGKLYSGNLTEKQK